jgi:iron complex outermembrane receptor protein
VLHEVGLRNTLEPDPDTPVTTTVVVHGEVEGRLSSRSVTVGTLDGAPLKETPLSATVVTRDLLNDQAARLLSDVVKNDASVGDDYVPVGYYGDYEIRGFPIDLATGLEINGMTIAGEQDVPLENKERVEFLKGIAGVESGVASGGGLIDYVTKRPATIKADRSGYRSSRNGLRRVDLGHLLRQPQAGGRARESCRRADRSLYERHQRLARHGRRRGRLEAEPESNFEGRLRVSAQGGARRQRLSVAGRHNAARHQPHLSSTMLGDQPWGPPDTYDTFNTGARLDYTFRATWVAFAAASYSHSLITTT